MKNKFLILIFVLIGLFLLATNVSFSQTYDSLAAKTEKTTIGSTDLFLLQTKVSNKYANRKLTGLSLWNFVDAVVDTFETNLLDASNSWNGINNFDGATFNSGSHGKVTFNDSTYFAGSSNVIRFMQPLSEASFNGIGSASLPYDVIYSNKFTLINPDAATDSAFFEYDGSSIVFDKGIVFNDSTKTLGLKNGTQLRSVTTDSLIGKYGLKLTTINGTLDFDKVVTNAGGRHSVNSSTTSLTIDSTFILLDATNTATIDTLHIGFDDSYISAFDMFRVTIMNEGAYDVTFTDTNGGAGFNGCMRLDSSNVLNQWDTLELIYYPNRQHWCKVGGSNN